MQRPFSMARWGHYGTPVLLFPTAGGDPEEAERNRLLEACGDLIDEGRVKIYSCDSTAGRALATGEGTPAFRMWLLNQYQDRKSTRLNSSHANISYAVFCLKKKTKTK